MPHSTAPRTFFLLMAPMANTAIRVMSMGKMVAQVCSPVNTLKECRFTQVEASLTTMPAFCRPMKAMNRPIPAEMATLTSWGMESKMILRRPVTVSSTKMMPSNSTSTRALA